MTLDPRIALMGQQMTSPAESFQKALSMREMLNRTRMQDQAIAEEKAMRDAFSKNVSLDPDGKAVVNRQAVLSDLYKANPMKAMEQEQAFSKLDSDAEDRKLKKLQSQTEAMKGLVMQMNPQNYGMTRQRGIEAGLWGENDLPAYYPGDSVVEKLKYGTLSAADQFNQKVKMRELDLKERELRGKAGSGSGFGKAPEGYSYQPDGTLAPIPGGPAAARMEEKRQALETPFGPANSVDDAKQLKEAFESKKSFDSKIDELINLRNEYGVEYLNREAVARAKQLSKDLLLEYKNMVKLGVLSKSDEDIINAIIPADPLGQDFALGQDPILSNLTKFKADSDRDFQTRVKTRTQSGIKTVAKPPRTESGQKSVFSTNEIEWME